METSRPEQEKDQASSKLERAARLVQLLDLYGALLTDRQRDFVRLHYAEDLSFGEIAREHGVSRQAVHDAVKHAEASLMDYDAKLGLTPEKGRRRGARAGSPSSDEVSTAAVAAASAPAGAVPPAAPAVDVAALEAVAARLEDVAARMRRSGGVIYNGEGLAREVAEAAATLRTLRRAGSNDV